MDLSAYSLQKLNRDKRERQPNWTEPEKLLLLSLTRVHQSILENKGSDTMTIKRKSEAWDDIAMRMNAAGYNRTKDRLKQQLGRIRAAESKKIKDAMERQIANGQELGVNILCNNLINGEHNVPQMMPHFKTNDNNIQVQDINTKIEASIAIPLQENHYIKIEKPVQMDENNGSEEDNDMNSSGYSKSNISTSTILNSSKDINTNEKDNINIKPVDELHFKLQNVQSLAEAHNINSLIKVDPIINNANLAESPISLNYSHNKLLPLSTEENHLVNHNNNENVATNAASSKNIQELKKRRRLRSNRTRRTQRNTFKREHVVQQLYLYRLAVERERLRNLRIQQKRDRILYLKDVEIQNLKLQILHNLTNQNRDSNRINF